MSGSRITGHEMTNQKPTRETQYQNVPIYFHSGQRAPVMLIQPPDGTTRHQDIGLGGTKALTYETKFRQETNLFYTEKLRARC